MKTKWIRILALVMCLLTLGALGVTAFAKAYTSYTYSIDGDPLPSPHAYTPDVETYDSVSMGLVAGYYWRYENGAVGVWTGNGMKPETLDADFSSEYLTYEKTEDGKAYVVTGLTKATENLAIPATYEGLKVVAIADNAFSANAGSLVSVIIGANVEKIGDGAFAHCRDLFDVFIPESVSIIGKGAFSDCYDLGVICVAAPAQPDGWDSEWLLDCDARVKWSSIDEE